MDITHIGQQIAALRKEKGVKQEELASYVGVTAQAVSKWENGGVPDTELLPVIADFFGISIDALFGRNLTDYQDLQSALSQKIIDTPYEERMEQAFEYCWTIERSLFGKEDKEWKDKDSSLAGYREKHRIRENDLHNSTIMTDHGYTRMSIATRLPYFLLVPEIPDTETALFEGIDYLEFFRDLSDKTFFDTLVTLYKRQSKKPFTQSLFLNKLGMTAEDAETILTRLKKYRLIHIEHIEMDDETREVYQFCPTPSFIALLIFAREMIDTPNIWSYYVGNRQKPYLA